MDKESKYKYRMEIQQMMFVSGERADALAETTSLVEEIVKAQVIEIVMQASALALKRGSRSMVVEDLIFLIRHDKAKVNRLRTYLSWKDVRKNAKEQEAGEVGGTELIEDPQIQENKKLYKKSKLRLPWEIPFMFSEQVVDDDEEADATEVEANLATLMRLKNADERTRKMTREEYVRWSECRQASFTFKKSKRFREWAGVSYLMESKPHDDIIDTLGFLTFEIVASLTEAALKIKEIEEGHTLAPNSQLKRKRERHLFDTPDEGQTPIKPEHIKEAYRKTQSAKPKYRALRNYTGGLLSYKTQIM